MDRITDTICAPATIPGTGAITLIRISGPDALSIADKVITLKGKSLRESDGHSVRLGAIADGNETIDEILATLFKAPHSYTGEDSVEISCHASTYICRRILEILCKEGCRMALPGEFTRRAFVNGKMDLAQAEAVADLICSSSEAAHRVALNQLKGSYSSKLKVLRDKLVETSALLELELDFSEEEVEFAGRDKLKMLLDDTISEVRRLSDSFKLGNAIKNGIPIAIVGGVNAGKSTLLNAILGDERAIVSPVAGTTRDTVEELFTVDGVQYRFIDTAGLRTTNDPVEKKGIERSFSALSKADIVIGVLDGTAPYKECIKSAQEILDRISEGQSLIMVRNKVDCYDAIMPEEFPTVDRSYGIFRMNYPAFGTYNVSPEELSKVFSKNEKISVIDISALTGEGMDQLLLAISEISRTRLDESGSDILVTSLRHFESLGKALVSLTDARNGLGKSLPTDLVSEDLRAAISSLNSIFGDSITPDEVLGEIFGKFCIGK